MFRYLFIEFKIDGDTLPRGNGICARQRNFLKWNWIEDGKMELTYLLAQDRNTWSILGKAYIRLCMK